MVEPSSNACQVIYNMSEGRQCFSGSSLSKVLMLFWGQNRRLLLQCLQQLVCLTNLEKNVLCLAVFFFMICAQASVLMSVRKAVASFSFMIYLYSFSEMKFVYSWRGLFGYLKLVVVYVANL